MDLYQDIKNNTLNKQFDLFGLHLLKDFGNVPGYDLISKIFAAFEYYPWIFSLIGSTMVGLSGVLPLLIIPIEEGENLKSGAGAKRLKILLSFAVGGLLGDVFLHLLPEAWEHMEKADERNENHPSLFCGIWVLIGMLVFVVVQKLFANQEENASNPDPGRKLSVASRNERQTKPVAFSSVNDQSRVVNNNTIYINEKLVDGKEHYHISGYLNLMANSIDNFTHGLAIGGSFCISFQIGVLSTFAILIHEIPHEVGDFAILLKSGFSRWDAAKAQILTASAGIMGSMLAVGLGSSESIESKTSWILPFTAGGFLNIALVNVLPDLIKEDSSVESFKQLASLALGILVMALLIYLIE